MNRQGSPYGILAAVLSVGWWAIHTFVGGAEVAVPLAASDLPQEVLAPAVMVWHMITWILVLLAVLFGAAVVRNSRDLMIAATALSGVIALAGLLSIPMTGSSFMQLPQGSLFLVTAILGGIAIKKMPANR